MSTIGPSSSRWSFPVLPASPTSRSTSSSGGAVSAGRFGIDARLVSRARLVSPTSESSSFTRAATSCISAIASDASSPDRLACAMASPAFFCVALSSSRCGWSVRQRSSSSMISSSPSAARRRASAARTASGSFRISLRSSMRLPASLVAEQPLLLAGVPRYELGHVLGVAPHHDVGRHDRAGEAAVANRVEHVRGRLLADVEVRPVRALGSLHLARRPRASGGGRAERVATAAALLEEDRAVVHGQVRLGHVHLLTAARREQRDQAEAAGEREEGPRHGGAYYPAPCGEPVQPASCSWRWPPAGAEQAAREAAGTRCR